SVHRLSGDDPALGVFLNRLSDLLFTLARVLGQADGSEVLWSPRPRDDTPPTA
ncbi:MAG: ATP:cob(I)alamin adenosyltransferase, partial [Gammaproteobacteria bacterium]|nr:ATP:cob(I)alamin adenosyltransferase [Gammaproteobacteria bacterium]